MWCPELEVLFLLRPRIFEVDLPALSGTRRFNSDLGAIVVLCAAVVKTASNPWLSGYWSNSLTKGQSRSVRVLGNIHGVLIVESGRFGDITRLFYCELFVLPC